MSYFPLPRTAGAGQIAVAHRFQLHSGAHDGWFVPHEAESRLSAAWADVIELFHRHKMRTGLFGNKDEIFLLLLLPAFLFFLLHKQKWRKHDICHHQNNILVMQFLLPKLLLFPFRPPIILLFDTTTAKQRTPTPRNRPDPRTSPA